MGLIKRIKDEYAKKSNDLLIKVTEIAVLRIVHFLLWRKIITQVEWDIYVKYCKDMTWLNQELNKIKPSGK